MRCTPKTILLAIVGLAVVVRIVAIVSIDHPQKVPRSLAESDAPTYYLLAENLLKGIGYRYGPDLEPTAKRTPGYPLFIAGIFRIFGRNFNAIRGVQCALEAVTTFLVFALCSLLFRNSVAGLLGSLAYALYPPGILSSTYIMTESLYAFLLTGFTVCLVIALLSRTKSLALAAGIIFGLATLTRPVGLVLPWALLAVGVIIRRNSWKLLAIMVLGFLVTMLPWAARNHRIYGKWIITSTLVGANLYKGNHLPTQGAFFTSTDSLFPPDLRNRLSGKDEVTRDSILREEALKTIMSNKKQVAALMLKKIVRLWFNLGYGRKPSGRSVLLAIAHALMLAFAIYGLEVMPPAGKFLSFVPLTIIVVSTLAYLAVAAEVRFVLPLVPLVLPFSAAGLMSALGIIARIGYETR